MHSSDTTVTCYSGTGQLQALRVQRNKSSVDGSVAQTHKYWSSESSTDNKVLAQKGNMDIVNALQWFPQNKTFVATLPRPINIGNNINRMDRRGYLLMRTIHKNRMST